jgi:hypothetical protein
VLAPPSSFYVMNSINDELTIDCSAPPVRRSSPPKKVQPKPVGRSAPVALTAKPVSPPDEWDSDGKPAELGSIEELETALVSKLTFALQTALRESLENETPSWRWTRVSLLCRRCMAISNRLEEKTSQT